MNRIGQGPVPDEYEHERQLMVDAQIVDRGIKDVHVIQAMRQVPRHLFVPASHVWEAYEDHPVTIGWGQTISQPFIVAWMLELARPGPTKRLLEVGSGCGYLLAVASKMFKEVIGIERIENLYHDSVEHLHALGMDQVKVLCGDGYEGAPQFQPYDAIIISCSCTQIPQPLRSQLAPGGILVAPVGDGLFQELMTVERVDGGEFHMTSYGGVRFVPLISPREIGP